VERSAARECPPDDPVCVWVEFGVRSNPAEPLYAVLMGAREVCFGLERDNRG